MAMATSCTSCFWNKTPGSHPDLGPVACLRRWLWHEQGCIAAPCRAEDQILWFVSLGDLPVLAGGCRC